MRGYTVVGCIDPEESCPTDPSRASSASARWSCCATRCSPTGSSCWCLGRSRRPPRSEQAELERGGAFRGRGVSRLEVFERVADACLDLPVSMIEAGQLYEQLFGHVPLGTTTSAWFQYLLHPHYKQGWPISKRLLDIGVGLVAGIIAAPVLAVSAIAIKLADGGPVLYRQTRIGEKGREIELLKLRTMDPDPTAAMHAGRRKGRRGTRVTAVGTRPAPPPHQRAAADLAGAEGRDEPGRTAARDPRSRHLARVALHLLRPAASAEARDHRLGLQSAAATPGTPMGEAWKLCHDLYYLKRRSVLFDLLIMLETLSTVFVPEPINRPDERFIVAARAGEEVQPSLESA